MSKHGIIADRNKSSLSERKKGFVTEAIKVLLIVTAIAGVAGTGLGGLIGAMRQKDTSGPGL